MTPKTSGITSIRDLKGKTVGLTSMRPSAFAESAFKEVGLDFNRDVKLIAIGFGAQAKLALDRGDAAAYLSFDTAVASIENLGMEFTYLEPSYFNDLFGLVLATREQMIADKPNVVIKVARGIAKSVHFGLANPDAAIKLHWKTYPESRPKGGDEAKLLQDARSIFLSRFDSYVLSGTDKYGENLPRQWEVVVGQMKDQGELPASFDPASAYTNQLVDEVNRWDRGAVTMQAKNWKE